MDEVDVSTPTKPFLTRFFEEVMAHVEVPYKDFDFSLVDHKEDDTS